LGDIGVHIIDLARYLVGEFKEVLGATETFIKERPLLEGQGQVTAASDTAKKKKKASKKAAEKPVDAPAVKLGEVTVDDAAQMIGRFESGALANLEATRYASGRKNHIAIEINGSKGSLTFDFEDMNRLQFFDTTCPADRQGFRDILVLQPGGVHPYVANWWKAGHPLGYEHPFVHSVADFVNACVDRKPVQPTFEDGLKNQRVLEAVEESVKTRRWVQV
jgi:predicted dehydrogenase